MAKDRENRKKDKKEKKEKKERKRREAEELAVREKKISKKHKSESKKAEKPEKSKKKSKKPEVEEKPHQKSKESKKKHKKSDESEDEPEKSDESEDEPETETVRSDDSHPVTVPVATITTTTTTTTNESDSDFELDKEDIKHLLESYSKEELVNLIYKTAEKGSRLISAVLESADRDSTKRNIFVRGLGWDTTHENLKAAFEVYGEIEECSVVMDKDTGRAKGYGFVVFKTRKGAREALRNPDKRMFNRTVSCNLAVAKPSGTGKPREPVESVKIDLTQSAEMPFYGLVQPPGYNPMYNGLMGNQGALMGNPGALIGNQMFPGLPNYRMFGPGTMMNQGPPNHMGMAGQYNGEVNGVGPGFDAERAWYLR